MARYMYSLPGRPDFRVFGLGLDFVGYRWLALWNDHDTLWTVTLGHGDPDSESWVAVETIDKQLETADAANPSVRHAATGFDDAALGTITQLSELAYAKDRNAQDEFLTREVGAVVPDRGIDGLSVDWIPDTLAVDGREHPCRRRDLNGAQAWLFDLPDVAVSVTRPSPDAPEVSALSDVSGRLTDYV